MSAPVARPRSQSGTTSTPGRSASVARSSARPARSSSGPMASGAGICSGRRSGPATRSRIRAVDVEHVEAERHAGEPLGLGDELLGQHRRGDDVEDVDPLQRHGPLAAELTRGQRRVGVRRRSRRRRLRGSRRAGCRGRGSGGRGSSGRRRRPPRCPRRASPPTGRAGAGRRRRSARGSGACPLAGPVRVRTRVDLGGRASPSSVPDRRPGLGTERPGPRPNSRCGAPIRA